MHNADVNDEELLTAFIGAKSLINSRPLTCKTVNPNDTVPLTPNHSLTGHIGVGWMREWVPSLSCRKKWYNLHKDLEVGDIVMIISTDSPRSHWPYSGVMTI